MNLITHPPMQEEVSVALGHPLQSAVRDSQALSVNTLLSPNANVETVEESMLWVIS